MFLRHSYNCSVMEEKTVENTLLINVYIVRRYDLTNCLPICNHNSFLNETVCICNVSDLFAVRDLIYTAIVLKK